MQCCRGQASSLRGPACQQLCIGIRNGAGLCIMNGRREARGRRRCRQGKSSAPDERSANGSRRGLAGASEAWQVQAGAAGPGRQRAPHPDDAAVVCTQAEHAIPKADNQVVVRPQNHRRRMPVALQRSRPGGSSLTALRSRLDSAGGWQLAAGMSAWATHRTQHGVRLLMR